MSSIRYVFLTAFTYPAEKLLDPLKLVDVLKNTSAKKPIIYNVGASAIISRAVLIGETLNPANQTKLKTSLKNIPTNSEIVIYCGCCKIEDCWNINKTNKILTGMGFTNFKFINLIPDFKQIGLIKNIL